MITIAIGANMFRNCRAINISHPYGVFGREFPENDKSVFPFVGGTLNKSDVIALRNFLNEILDAEEKNGDRRTESNDPRLHESGHQA